MIPAIPVITVLGLALAFFCTRVAEWHSKESDYWKRVHMMVIFDPAQDAIFKPILHYSQTNRPSNFQMAMGWRSPEERIRSDA